VKQWPTSLSSSPHLPASSSSSPMRLAQAAQIRRRRTRLGRARRARGAHTGATRRAQLPSPASGSCPSRGSAVEHGAGARRRRTPSRRRPHFLGLPLFPCRGAPPASFLSLPSSPAWRHGPAVRPGSWDAGSVFWRAQRLGQRARADVAFAVRPVPPQEWRPAGGIGWFRPVFRPPLQRFCR
jgi:hypothetical protein